MATKPRAILNTSPLLYLHRAHALYLLADVFSSVCSTPSVMEELEVGGRQGLDVPSSSDLEMVQICSPTPQPEPWQALDLGMGEASVIALASQERDSIAVLDDLQARRIAIAAGLSVWGTLRILIEAKRMGSLPNVGPLIDLLAQSGMWISSDVRQRIRHLAGE
jgi:predicted nucleic acid-binding protein